jgi:hypothetical protein
MTDVKIPDHLRGVLPGQHELRLLRAYRQRPRQRCSLEDYADGYLAALRDNGLVTVHANLPAGVDPASVVRTVR